MSMRDLLNRRGYDVRVTSATALPRSGPLVRQASATTQAIEQLPDVRGALAIRFADARFNGLDNTAIAATFNGITGTAEPPWSLLRGPKPAGTPDEVVVSDTAAQALKVDVGSTLPLSVRCRVADEALPPLPVRVTAVTEFTPSS